MAFDPEPGLVIRYDFLWQHESEAGLEFGRKDRPCAVVLMSKPMENGGRLVAVCPITHTPPAHASQSVEIPPKVAQHLGLDQQRSWIRTDTVNTFSWEPGRIPFGITPAKPNQWYFGMLPAALGRRVFDQLRTNSRQKPFYPISRDGKPERRQ